MTLEQLKSLRVGDIVRYTNKEDASNTYVSTVSHIDSCLIELTPNNKDAYVLIAWSDKDIEHIASTLALVENTNNELQIILHQIRDLEFDMTINKDDSLIRAHLRSQLTDLRNKRDNLLKQNI